MSLRHFPHLVSLAAFFGIAVRAPAGFAYQGLSPANPPWPGGIIPYVIDPALGPAQRKAYLDGVREWELAAAVQFVPRTTQASYVLFKYDPFGPNRVSGANPQLVEVNALTRSQICHEMGHSLGLDHEHTRPDRDAFVTVQTANITAGNEHWFDIVPDGVMRNGYDFESVMHFGRDLFSIQPGTLDTLTVKPGFERYQARMGNFALSPGDRMAAAWLYGPATLSPVVTTTADTGPGSLRAALYHATDHPGTTITFNIPISDPGFAGGVFTIRPTGHFPPLVANGTRVDASTQPGYAGNPLVFIDGADILSESGEPPGMMIYAANCEIKGLGFVRSKWVGVAILHPDAVGNRICSCWSGVAPSGGAAQPNAKQGIQISGGAHGNTIGPDNVLAGNTEYGVWISGAATVANVVTGNRIGTNAAGNAALPNGFGGVIVTDGAASTTIGPDNVISGNTNAGVWLTGTGVVNNIVTGNLIGTGASGNSAVPNSFVGVYALDGASDNDIRGNVIAGNGSGFGYGVYLGGTGTEDNVVEGNLIGVTRGGSPLGNAFTGIALLGGASDHVISANQIAHHSAGYGIALYDAPTTGNTFRENSIHDNAFGGIAIGPANQAQAPPVLTTASMGPSGLAVSGTLNSAANTAFRIEFLASESPGWDEGRTPLGAIEGVTTDGGGLVSFNAVLTAAPPPGRAITAIATRSATGDSSEFSGPLAITVTDSDTDGMPDFFEDAHTLNNSLDDADDDADGDGFTNFLEYLAGTNPRNANDLLRPLSVAVNGNQLVIAFRTVSGRSYALETSETLAPNSWSTVVPVKTAISATTEFTVPVALGETKRFHRLRLLE